MITLSAREFFKKFERRKLWRRITLRHVAFSDNYDGLNSLYLLPDPWGMETEKEIHRFNETNRLIQKNFGGIDRLLELGCAEGHQSERLQQVCNRLYGVDVSQRAIVRARKRCQGAIFDQGDIFSAQAIQGIKFDLVVACEVLMYIKDVEATLERMSNIAKGGLVTYLTIFSEALDPFFERVSQNQKADIRFGGTHWKAVWWYDGLSK
jgi:2-polyprenyl-3-methyl-5-hydroxy-6-metoxy-1,4-benzoquinol methylase